MLQWFIRFPEFTDLSILIHLGKTPMGISSIWSRRLYQWQVSFSKLNSIEICKICRRLFLVIFINEYLSRFCVIWIITRKEILTYFHNSSILIDLILKPGLCGYRKRRRFHPFGLSPCTVFIQEWLTETYTKQVF